MGCRCVPPQGPLLPLWPHHVLACAWHPLGVMVTGDGDLETLCGHLRQVRCPWGGGRDVTKEVGEMSPRRNDSGEAEGMSLG